MDETGITQIDNNITLSSNEQSTLYNKDLMVIDKGTYKITQLLRHEIKLAFIDNIWSVPPDIMIYDVASSEKDFTGDIHFSGTKRIYDILEQSEYMELLPQIEEQLSEIGMWGITTDIWQDDIYISEGRIVLFPSKIFKRYITSIGLLKESIAVAGAIIRFYEQYTINKVFRGFTIQPEGEEESKLLTSFEEATKVFEKFAIPTSTIKLYQDFTSDDYGGIDFTPAFDMKNLAKPYRDLLHMDYRLQSVEESWDAMQYEQKYNRTKFIFVRDGLEFETDFGIKQLNQEEDAMLRNAAFALNTTGQINELKNFPWQVVKSDTKLIEYWQLITSQINEIYKIVGIQATSVGGGTNKTKLEVTSTAGRTNARMNQKIAQRQKDLKKLIEHIIEIDIKKLNNQKLYPKEYFVKVIMKQDSFSSREEQIKAVDTRLNNRSYDLLRAIMELDNINPLEAKLEKDRIANAWKEDIEIVNPMTRINIDGEAEDPQAMDNKKEQNKEVKEKTNLKKKADKEQNK